MARVRSKLAPRADPDRMSRGLLVAEIGEPEAMMERPHIMYVHSHDTGRYIQPYGYAVPTPHFQRLAEEGVLFRQNFCTAPTCSPSRAGLLTGQTPHSCGMLGLVNRGFLLEHPERHLAQTLRVAGYETMLAGVQHVHRNPAVTGYEVIREYARNAEEITATAIDYLERAHERPFFLDVGYHETHRVFPKPGPREDPRYALPPAILPDTPETRADMAAFKASARRLDEQVGQLLQCLHDLGLAEQTLVIATTDHGPAFPGMKCNVTDHGTGVSLIIRGPGGFRGGGVVDAMVSHLDIVPTICDVAGIERPDWLQGRSLMPLVAGTVEELHEELFAEVNYHAAYEPQRAVRTKRWKYIRRYTRYRYPHLANCDDGPSKEVWMRYGWPERMVATEQLYDLMFDPLEVHNLADDAAYAGVLAEMRGRLQRWMEATDDPLVRGPIPLPEGAWVNEAEALSPHER